VARIENVAGKVTVPTSPPKFKFVDELRVNEPIILIVPLKFIVALLFVVRVPELFIILKVIVPVDTVKSATPLIIVCPDTDKVPVPKATVPASICKLLEIELLDPSVDVPVTFCNEFILTVHPAKLNVPELVTGALNVLLPLVPIKDAPDEIFVVVLTSKVPVPVFKVPPDIVAVDVIERLVPTIVVPALFVKILFITVVDPVKVNVLAFVT